MAGKRVLLTLNPKIYELLEQRAADNYMSIQELIADILREDVLASQHRKKSKPKNSKNLRQ